MLYNAITIVKTWKSIIHYRYWLYNMHNYWKLTGAAYVCGKWFIYEASAVTSIEISCYFWWKVDGTLRTRRWSKAAEWELLLNQSLYYCIMAMIIGMSDSKTCSQFAVYLLMVTRGRPLSPSYRHRSRSGVVLLHKREHGPVCFVLSFISNRTHLKMSICSVSPTLPVSRFLNPLKVLDYFCCCRLTICSSVTWATPVTTIHKIWLQKFKHTKTGTRQTLHDMNAEKYLGPYTNIRKTIHVHFASVISYTNVDSSFFVKKRKLELTYV